MGNKVILFDLDGTLTDSGEGIFNCAALALTHFGIPVPPRAQMRVFVGPPLDDSFRRFGVPADRVEEAIAVYRSRYLTVGKFENFPYPGIRELLKKLKQDGYPLYVATSKPEPTAIEVLEHFALAPYFTDICGATLDGSRSKKADVIAYVLSKLSGSRDAVMVGDTAYDVLGAAAHGIPTIGVSWGYGLAEDMRRAGAKDIADTTDSLYALLRQTI